MIFMTYMDTMSAELRAAYPYFKAISPSPAMALRGTSSRIVSSLFTLRRAVKAIQRNDTFVDASSDFLADYLRRKITGKVMKPIVTEVTKVHKIVEHAPKKDFHRKNGLGGRYWYWKPSRETMTIIFHDANRAGPHIDVHVGRLSVVYRVKPELYSQLKYNNDGMLTENSRQLILNHVREEILKGARVPQNLDHSVQGIKSSWVNGDPDAKHYGAGRTRQVISVSEVDIYKAYKDGPIEMYAPALYAYRNLYMYRLYEGDGIKAPILIWGAKSNHPPLLDDRLHLKMVPPEILEADKLYTHADPETSTAKYDGSSAYIVIGPKGTTIWSPRTSKVTGDQIEYTGTLHKLAGITSPVTIVAMGEVLFKEKNSLIGKPSSYIPQATGSGILNSNRVIPKNIEPEIRIYRVDKIGKESHLDKDFWTNRLLQEEVASLCPKYLKVVELMPHDQALLQGFEGIVAVPTNQSVNHGIKIKYWQEPHDWRIDSIDLIPGSKGGIAGVVKYTSLESGREFKLGPSNVGDRTTQMAMMLEPDAYIGAVVKVRSRHGHEGRASQVVAFHDDKGIAPPLHGDL